MSLAYMINVLSSILQTLIEVITEYFNRKPLLLDFSQVTRNTLKINTVDKKKKKTKPNEKQLLTIIRIIVLETSSRINWN